MQIALRNVSKSFGDRKVFENLSLDFDEGKINCILGPSGCGKTTVLNILAGLCDCEGEVERPERVSYIFQGSRLLPNLTVWENVEYAVLRMEKREREEKIEKLLKMCEIYERRNDLPAALSGGMARRVSIARAYAYPAQLMLMDEPFSALDLGLKLRQIKVYNELAREFPRTTIFVTHDIDEALLFADAITVMRGGTAGERMEIHSPREQRSLFSEESVKLKERLFELLI